MGGVEVDTASDLGSVERTVQLNGLFPAPINLLPAKNSRYNLNRGVGGGPHSRSGRFGTWRNSNCGPSVDQPGFIIVTELSLLEACMGEIRNG